MSDQIQSKPQNISPKPQNILPKPQNILLGAAILSVAMLTIPGLDAIAKHLSSELSPLYIAWARYMAASMIILPISMMRYGLKDRAFLPQRNMKSHFMRTFFIIAAMVCFFISISTTPLAVTTAVTMSAPIIATLAAYFLLGETLTWPKITALILGFIGAMIIINPSADMEVGMIFAVFAGLFYGMYIVTTRMTARASDPVKTLAFQCFMGMIYLIPIVIFYWEMPNFEQLTLILAIGALSVFCHGLTIIAFQYAQAATLSPLVYLEIISAAILGYIFFDDVPTLAFWIGTCLIVIGGLCVSFSKEKPEQMRR